MAVVGHVLALAFVVAGGVYWLGLTGSLVYAAITRRHRFTSVMLYMWGAVLVLWSPSLTMFPVFESTLGSAMLIGAQLLGLVIVVVLTVRLFRSLRSHAQERR